jgi:hypothetical protein
LTKQISLNSVLPTKIVDLSIGYVDKTIEEVETTKFIGLQVDSSLNWKTHI